MPTFRSRFPNRVSQVGGQIPQNQGQGIGAFGRFGQQSPVQSLQNLFGQFQRPQGGYGAMPQQTLSQSPLSFGQAMRQTPQSRLQLGQMGGQPAGAMPPQAPMQVPTQGVQNTLGQFNSQLVSRPQVQVPIQNPIGFEQMGGQPAGAMPPQAPMQVPTQGVQNPIGFEQMDGQPAGAMPPQAPMQVPTQGVQNTFDPFKQGQGMMGIGQNIPQNPQLRVQLGPLSSQTASNMPVQNQAALQSLQQALMGIGQIPPNMPIAPTTQQIRVEDPRLQAMRSLQRFNVKGTG